MENRKTDIVSLNRDVERFVLQAAATRSEIVFKKAFGDPYRPLCFVHASDMHNVPSAWDRMVQYINHYSDCISFAVHTGDYCGGSQKLYADMYAGEKCVRPIYNCVGNHDCYAGEGTWQLNKKEVAHGLLFNHADEWEATFMDCDCSMSYYKDFPEANVRMIVLDDYYDIPATREWLRGILADAREKKLAVITAQHEQTDFVTHPASAHFYPYDDFIALNSRPYTDTPPFDARGRLLFEDLLVDFIRDGGQFICNLAGHEHIDYFGYTDAGILNAVVASGTTWDGISDMRHVDGTKAMDCFNVVAVDVNLGLLKLVRIGGNVDHYMRTKTALCYDYVNKKMIAEC